MYYAILHKPSGKFIQAFGKNQSKGGTHLEPGDGCPRLFANRVAAGNALKWWLKGKTIRTFGGGYFEDDDVENWHLEPVPERKAEDMAIVEVRLQILTPAEGDL